MQDKVSFRARWRPPVRFSRTMATAVPFVLAAFPVLAQSVSGSVDPATGLNSLAVYALALVAGAMVLVAAYKGLHAFMEGRSIGPTVAGLMGGLVLAFGGYYILQKYGVSSTTST